MCSVPQGFILGPVLFNIFTNYIDNGIECTVCKSVGDAKVKIEVERAEGVPSRGTLVNSEGGLL